MAIIKLSTVEDLNQFLQSGGQQVLLKHSTTCPISAAAYEEFQAFVNGNNISAGIVLVIEDRPLSNHIAEQFNIKHESPQVLLFDNGVVKWNASHWKITKSSLTEATH